MAVENILRTALFVSVLSACSNAADSIADRTEHDYSCRPDFPSDNVSAPYVEMLKENPKIINALDYCNQSGSFQEKLWEKINLAETSGKTASASAPKSLSCMLKSLNCIEPDSDDSDKFMIQLTPEEAYEIYASHIAHSLWLEKAGTTSWRLRDYSLEELKTLFNPLIWFWDWQPEEQKFSMAYLIDHSPKETFAVLNETIDLANMLDQKTSILEMIRKLRHFRHGDPGFCHDPEMISTLKTMHEEKISRKGCQSMSAYLVSLATAANIPGETVRGYYGGVGHRSALFKLTGDVLAHGDDVYASFLQNTSTEKIMDSYDFWEKNILVHQPYMGIDSEVAYKSRIKYMENSLNHIARLLTIIYCEKGRSYLEEYFDGYASVGRIDKLESEIKNLTDDCTTYPLDNPDGTGSYLNMCTPPHN